jgi:hypothetical protein
MTSIGESGSAQRGEMTNAGQAFLADDSSYDLVDAIPLLCTSCQEPLTLSTTMKSLAIATRPSDTPIQASQRGICHACRGQEKYDPSR